MTNPLKSLQILAKKHEGLLEFDYYRKEWKGVYYFGKNSNKSWVEVTATNFTTMLHKLNKEVKKI